MSQVLRYRRALGAASVVLFAGCYFPPSVAPTASLGPRDGKGSGPRTGSAFAVAWAGPKGEVTDRSDPAITVLFNRSMRSLDTPEDQALPRLDVTANGGAPVAGSLRWVGTRGLLFVPDKPLPGGSHVAVTVPGETKTIDGTALGAPYSFELTTPRPLVARTFPGAGARTLRPDASFTFVMNQDVTPEALMERLHIVARHGDGDPGEPVSFHVTRAEPTRDQRGDERALRITPDKPMPLDLGLEITIAAGLRGEGPLTMDKPYTWQGRTYGPLRLAEFHCPRIAREGRCKAHNDIKVTMSNPVAPDELRRHLKAPGLLATAKPKTVKRAPETGASQWLLADPQFGRKYKVTLTAGMRDIFGQTLAQDATFDVETEAPFSGTLPPAPAAGKKGRAPAKPAVVHHTAPARVAHVAAPVPTAPHRPQLDYNLQLGLTGSVLEAMTATGVKTHKLPVGSVNIPTYEISTSSIAQAQALAWLGGTAMDDFITRNHIPSEFVIPTEAENLRSVRTVDLDALLGKTRRGAAFVALQVPGEPTARQTLVRVTDLGITAKASALGSLVWVTSLATGKPVAGATVSLRTPEKGEIVASRTDDQGMTEIPADKFDPFGEGKDKDDKRAKPPAFLFVSAGDDWTFERFQRSSVDQRATAGIQALNAHVEALGMAYTDRGVYRPGEALKIGGMFRALDASGMRPLVGDEARVELQAPSGEVVASTRIGLDKFGAFTAELKLPKSTGLGDARVVASVHGRGRNAEAVQLFKVADYKTNEFKVETEADAKAYVRGDDAIFSVKSEFLFGGAMAGATAHTTLTRTVTTFAPPGSDGFVVSDEAGTADAADVKLRTEDLGASDDTLDAEGRASRKLRLEMPGQAVPERVEFEAEVQDLSHQTVSQRVSVLVHPAEFYLGLGEMKDHFVSAGGSVHADVAAFEAASSARRGGVPVKVELVERTWTGAVEEHGDEGAHRTSRAKDEIVGTCEVRTSVQTNAGCDLKVPEAGYFVMRATAKDPRGNPVRVSQSFYGTEGAGQTSPSASVAWADNDARVLHLETNKKSYEIGETAKVLVRSPFRDAQALVTVERGGVITRKTLRVSGPLPLIELPVTAEMYPNAYVSVHLVRGRVGAPPEKGADVAGPEFRLGYAELGVNKDAHRLSVAVKTAKQEFQPGEELDVDLAVTDHAGKPAESELTFFAVDEGVLMLTGYKTPDPLPAFTGRRMLSVFNLESREELGQVTPLHPGERVATLGFDYLTRSGDKGSPGGGGGVGPLRADFKTTAYFEAGKITDREGKARIHFKLPDNLTTFRLMAVAAGQTDFFGSGEAKVTTHKRLMARPSLPRLLRVGDELDASVVLTAKDLVDQDVDVSLAVTNLVPKGPASQRVKIPKTGSIEVHFPIAAQAPGEVTFDITARSGGDADHVRVTKKVELPVSAEMVAAYGETRDGATISLGDLSGMRTDQGELRLRAAPTALVGLSTSMEQLLDYPYGCTEQLASRTLPLASLSDLAKDFGVRLPANVPHAIEEAVDAIVKNQRDDGGFGFWENSPRSEPWLSAYVMLTLDAAKKAGSSIPPNLLDSTANYLRAALNRMTIPDGDEAPPPETADPPPNRGGLSPEDAARLDYTNATFIVDALATIGSPDPGTMSRLYDMRRGKPLGARALLLQALVAGKASPDLVATLAREIEGELRIDANQAVARYDEDDVGRATFESGARTTALVLRAFIAADKHHPLAPRLARGLLGLRADGAWRSTQENGWALLAIHDYRAAYESSKKEIEARAFLGRDLIASRTFHGTEDAELIGVVPAARVVSERGPVAFQLVGDGELFYTAELKYTTAVLPKDPRDEGLFVKKLVRAVKPEEIKEAVEWIPKKSLDQAPAGSLVLVDLLLESAEARRQVVIDDPLPSGVEPIDTALDTATKSRRVEDETEEAAKEKAKPTKRVARPDALTGIGAAFRTARARREMRDDRVLTFIEELPPGMYHFRYLARATTVGRFVVPPTRVQAMYSPEVWGSTGATTFEVQKP